MASYDPNDDSTDRRRYPGNIRDIIHSEFVELNPKKSTLKEYGFLLGVSITLIVYAVGFIYSYSQLNSQVSRNTENFNKAVTHEQCDYRHQIIAAQLSNTDRRIAHVEESTKDFAATITMKLDRMSERFDKKLDQILTRELNGHK